MLMSLYTVTIFIAIVMAKYTVTAYFVSGVYCAYTSTGTRCWFNREGSRPRYFGFPEQMVFSNNGLCFLDDGYVSCWGYVDVRSQSPTASYRTVYKVTVNADCSTKITTVKVPGEIEE
jgi:hypothetical protein